MKKFRLILMLFILPVCALAQGAQYTGIAQTARNMIGMGNVYVPIPGASVNVCTGVYTGTACASGGNVTVYSNQALSTALPQPLTADNYGNFTFWAAPGAYYFTVTGQGAASSSYQITLPFGVSGTYNATAKSIEQVRYADQWCGAAGVLDQSCIVNAANSSGAKVVDVPPGTYTVSSSTTFPAGVTYKFETGAILAVPLGVTATFAGPVVAPNQQIFSLVAPVSVTDAAMASGSSTVTSASGLFTAAMVGAPITVFGCSSTAVGGVNEACHGTIAAFNSSTSVTASFTNASGASISSKTAYFGGSYVDFLSTASATAQLNVRWFGATGDGSTDDTNGVQAAMITGEQSGLPVYASAGTYLVGNIQLGNPATQTDWDTSANVHTLPGISELEGAGIVQTSFKAKAGTTGYVLARENRANIVVRDFEIDGNNTAGGCWNDAWLAVGAAGVAPASDQDVANVRCQNFTGTGPAYGIWADNQNDSKFDNVIVAGPNGSVYDFYADAATGWFNLVNSKFYSGKVGISAQNATFAHDLFFGGFVSIGQGANVFDFSGVQFGPAADTGVDFNSTNSGNNGTHALHCSGCWFTAANSQTVFSGKFYLGADITDSYFNLSGTGSIFGTITTCCAPYYPTFRLTEDAGVPATLVAPSSVNLITSLNDNAGLGTIGKWLSTSSNLIYSANNTGLPGILAINSSAPSNGQVPLDFTVGGTMEGRIRADSTGALNIIAGGSTLYLWTGGDAGAGAIAAHLTSAGFIFDKGATLASGQTLDASAGTLKQPSAYTVGANTITNPSSAGTLAITAQLPLFGSVAGSTTSLAANTCGDVVTQTVTGAATTMTPVVTVDGALPTSGLVIQAAVTSANTVSIEYCNVTTGSVVPAAATLEIRVIQ